MVLFLSLTVSGILAGCGEENKTQKSIDTETQKETVREQDSNLNSRRITPTTEITQLEEGLSVVCYEGDDGFSAFLEQGGAKSDADVARYISEQLSSDILLFLRSIWTL
ncbi:MAG: hypothetical protein KH355_10540 [Clostridiales bacterium]|nr:hypothetical protein [Clostridiales bacterium]